MPKRTYENKRDDARLGEHASRASALLAARAEAVKGNAKQKAKPTMRNVGGPSAASQQASKPTARTEKPSAKAAAQQVARPDARLPFRSSTSSQKPRSGGLAGFVRRNAKYIAGVVVVLLVAVAGIAVLRALSPDSMTLQETPGEASSHETPYDWTKLDRSGGHYRYIVDGKVKSRLGVDVSENQHDIDWNAVAADGIDFAMVRVGYRGATEGDLYLDSHYWNNIR